MIEFTETENHREQKRQHATIVIVDDSLDDLRLLSTILQTETSTVHLISESHRALEAIQTLRPEVILLKTHMADGDGYTLCDQLKANAHTRDIPIIFIGALDTADACVQAFAHGGVDYLRKPFYAEEVQARVATHLRLYQQQRRLQEELVQQRQHEAALQHANHELEQRLARCSRQLRLAQFSLDHAADSILWVRSDGRFVYANEAAYAMLGYSPDELLAMTVPELDLNFSVERFTTFWEEMCQDGATMFESKQRCKDGNPVPVEISVAHMTCDEHEYLCAFVRNITERKQMHEALETERRRLFALLDQLPAYVYLIAPDYSVRFANSYFREHFGGPQETLNCYHNVFATETPCDPCPVQAVFEHGTPQVWETAARDGRTYTIHAYPFTDVDGTPLVLELGIDISERKQAEEQLRQSQAALQHANAELEHRVAARTAELQENQALLHGLLDNSPAFIFVNDLQGRYLLINRNGAALMGLTPEQVIGKLQSDMVPLATVEQWRAEDYQVLSQQQPCIFEQVVPLDTGIHTHMTTKFPIVNAQGEVYAIGGIITDITERRRMEEALRKSEERLRHILHCSPNGVLVLDNQGIIQYANPLACHLLHKSDPEGLPFGLPVVAGESCETDIATPGGNTVCELRVTETDWDGTPSYVISMSDITERRRAEHDLRKLYRAIEQSPVSVVITDINGAIEYVNPKFTQVTGYTFEEALGENPRILKSGTTPPEVYADLWQTILAGNEWQGEFYNRKKDGSCYWEAASISPITSSDGSITRFVAVKEDITPRKLAEAELQQAKEQAEAANRAKSAFLANMSHELRTPLNAILGFAQLLVLDNRLLPEQQEHLGIIERSGEHLLALINDVLEMSKIEAGRPTLHNHHFDLHRMLDDLDDIFRLRATEKHLQLRFNLAPHTPRTIYADERKLRQVLMNLLSNAIKFTRQGHISVYIGTHSPPAHMAGETEKPGNATAPVAGSMLCCSVEDTGLGIEWGDLEHIFDAFYQTSQGKYVYEGTGLGLPISRNFVQMMGGELHVESAPGCGSMFWFEIPIQVDKTSMVDVGDRAKPFTPHQATTPLPGQPAYRVLVVEDEAYNRALLTRLLEMLGMEVRGALHGQEAIEYWKQWAPHIIFMDMRMPVMDGYEATRRIKALSKVKTPDAPLTPIVALTASVFMEDRNKIMAVGCDDFIQKPFHQVQICEMLVKHLGVRFAVGAQQAEPHERATQDPPAEPLLQEMVAAMPERWVLEMSYAASVADVRKVEQLIAELEEQHGMLAHELTRHVQDFRFDKIMALLEQVRQGSTVLHERVRETI